MKKVLKTELSITYRNLLWRIFAPFTVLELLGFSLDRTFHLHKFFKVSFAFFALLLTIWGLFVTADEQMRQKEL